MCHKLPLNGRLKMHPVTIPLAELFLSKAQIVQFNRKDAFDIISLLLTMISAMSARAKSVWTGLPGFAPVTGAL